MRKCVIEECERAVISRVTQSVCSSACIRWRQLLGGTVCFFRKPKDLEREA